MFKELYSFFTSIKFFDIIVATVEDITEKFEQDILTGGYNRQGFYPSCGTDPERK